MTVQPKVMKRFNAVSIKLKLAFSTELEQKNLKICMDTSKTLNSQSNPEKEKWNWKNQFP